MARIVALYMTPKDRDAFDRYYHATHVPLAKKLPGLREYDISQGPIQTAAGPADVHLVATLTFDSVQAIESALGQTHAEFSGTGRFFDLDGMPLPQSMLAEVLATGVPVRDVERLVKRDDGTQFFVSINIDPLRNARGELVGAVNCFVDITERKRTDEALEQSRVRGLEQEQRLAATYEHAAIGISEVDPGGQFLRVNEAITAIINVRMRIPERGGSAVAAPPLSSSDGSMMSRFVGAP